MKNCDRGQAEGSIFKTEVTVFHYTDRPKPVNNLFIFFPSLKRLCLLTGKNSRKRYCDRGQRKENPDRAKNQSDCTWKK